MKRCLGALRKDVNAELRAIKNRNKKQNEETIVFPVLFFCGCWSKADVLRPAECVLCVRSYDQS